MIGGDFLQHFDYTKFRGEVKKQMVVQNIADYKTLSEMTGRSHRTIGAFMCGVRNSPNTALELKNALNIKQKFGFETLAKG